MQGKNQSCTQPIIILGQGWYESVLKTLKTQKQDQAWVCSKVHNRPTNKKSFQVPTSQPEFKNKKKKSC
jgi:hypothetical protein